MKKEKRLSIKTILRRMGYGEYWLKRKIFRDPVRMTWYVIVKDKDGKLRKNDIVSDTMIEKKWDKIIKYEI